MCDSSKVNDMLAATSASSSSSSSSSFATPTISASKLRHARDQYYLIDIREAEEIAEDPLPDDTPADIEVPMGKLLAAGVAEEWIHQKGVSWNWMDGKMDG